MIRRNWRSAPEHPGSGPAKGHLARLPALDVPAGAPHVLDHRLDWVCRGERARERAGYPEARPVLPVNVAQVARYVSWVEDETPRPYPFGCLA